MTHHECACCHRKFPRAQHLQKHLERQTPCSPHDPLLTKSYACDGCDKTFAHKSNLCRHRHVCTGRVPTVESLQQEVMELRQQVQGLTQVPAVSHVDNSITHNNITNNVINVTLNTYGAEEQQYLESLTYPQLKKILKLSPDNESLLNMIKFIYKNTDHPENNNVRLQSRDSDVINVYKNRVWKEEKTDPTVYDIICRSRVRFIDVEPQLSAGMAKARFEALTGYLEKAEDMANSEDKSLYSECVFSDLISKVKDMMV